MERNLITVLGSGTSTGIPMLGCECDVCKSEKQENKRTRSSIVLTIKGKDIIVDTTPDMRSQLLRENINNIDAAIITHDHADHIHGIDDLRPFSFKHAVPLYTHSICAKNLITKFPYIFNSKEFFNGKQAPGGGIPKLELNITDTDLTIFDEKFEIELLPHGRTRSLSFSHSNFAYIIDCHEVPDGWIDKLKSKNLDLLIIDCVRYRPHETHLCFDDAINVIKKINPKRAGLIHIAHEIEHFELIDRIAQLKLDIDIFPLVDGMKLQYS